MNRESYVDGLLYELRGATQSGNKEHEAAVRAELRRVGASVPGERERAVNKAPRETRKG